MTEVSFLGELSL